MLENMLKLVDLVQITIPYNTRPYCQVKKIDQGRTGINPRLLRKKQFSPLAYL